MNEPAHILISGRDVDLLSTRALVLRSRGYRVSQTLKAARYSSELSAVDLLVVCHTLDAEERDTDLSDLSLASPEAKVLCLNPRSGPPVLGVMTLDSFAGPREMLRVVHRLLSA